MKIKIIKSNSDIKKEEKEIPAYLHTAVMKRIKTLVNNRKLTEELLFIVYMQGSHDTMSISEEMKGESSLKEFLISAMEGKNL